SYGDGEGHKIRTLEIRVPNAANPGCCVLDGEDLYALEDQQGRIILVAVPVIAFGHEQFQGNPQGFRINPDASEASYYISDYRSICVGEGYRVLLCNGAGANCEEFGPGDHHVPPRLSDNEMRMVIRRR